MSRAKRSSVTERGCHIAFRVAEVTDLKLFLYSHV